MQPRFLDEKVRSFSGLQAGLRRGPVDHAAGTVCDKEETVGSAAGVRESRLRVPPGCSQGRVHSELDTSRPAQLVRDAKSMFQRPRVGTEACTLSRFQTVHRPVFLESPGARTRVPVAGAASPRSGGPVAGDLRLLSGRRLSLGLRLFGASVGRGVTESDGALCARLLREPVQMAFRELEWSRREGDVGG